MAYGLGDVEQVSYDLEKEIMIVQLKKSVIHKKYYKKRIKYKVSYDVFVETSDRFINYKY